MVELATPLVEEVDSPGEEYRVLESGNRRLEIWFKSEHVIATTITSDSGERIAGATTALYSTAREIMQQRANAKGEPHTYVFVTVNAHMIEWAKTKGQDIFGWEEIPGVRRFEAQKEFRPEVPII